MGVNIVNWTRGLGQLRQTDSEVEASFKKTNVFPRPRIRLLFQRVVSRKSTGSPNREILFVLDLLEPARWGVPASPVLSVYCLYGIDAALPR
jgi:hypothetical protein